MNTDCMELKFHYNFDIPVIRGFLGRQEYRRRLAQAKSEAERVKHLADDIYNINIHLCNQLQIAKQNDTKIPPSKSASRSLCVKYYNIHKMSIWSEKGGGEVSNLWMFLRVLNSVRNVILKPIYKHLTQFRIANSEGAEICNKCSIARSCTTHVQCIFYRKYNYLVYFM